MKQKLIKKVSDAGISIEAIPALLDQERVAFEPITCVNWAEYPYAPEAKFRIAHTGRHILLNYVVTEASVRAMAGADNESVWEDACVEFFSIPQTADGIYYNVECNCVGQILMAAGAKREGREPAPQAVIDTIERWCSLGREGFAERIGVCTWQVVLRIPCSAYFKHHLTDLSGITMRANFYKCGDKLQTPHFLSWNPIKLPSPNFHCPPFFGEVTFEE